MLNVINSNKLKFIIEETKHSPVQWANGEMQPNYV